MVSAVLGFWQQRSAANALGKLLQLVQIDIPTLRDGKENRIPLEHIVPGDIVVLSAGITVPGDCRLLVSKDLYSN